MFIEIYEAGDRVILFLQGDVLDESSLRAILYKPYYGQ